MELEEFINRLASAEPSPGGGAAAALTGALAAGLFAKACNLTIGREKFKAFEAAVRRLLDHVEPLRRRLFDLIEADAAAYREVAAAYRMPRQSDAEKAARAAAIQAARKQATERPLAHAGARRDPHGPAPCGAHKTHPTMGRGVALGAVLAHAAAHGVWFNIKDNLDNVTDQEFRTQVSESVASIRGDCDALLAEVSRVLPDYFNVRAGKSAAG